VGSCNTGQQSLYKAEGTNSYSRKENRLPGRRTVSLGAVALEIEEGRWNASFKRRSSPYLLLTTRDYRVITYAERVIRNVVGGQRLTLNQNAEGQECVEDGRPVGWCVSGGGVR
jgi:hypothetical protein